MKMKQEDGESYGDFYNRFAVMATRSGFDETSLRWYLLKALSKPTLERLRGSNIIPADYQTLHRHLRDLDINDHSMMEAGLIDGYDVQVATMPSSSSKTTTTTSTSTNASSSSNPNTTRTTVTRTQNVPSGGRTTVTNTRSNFVPRSNYQNRNNNYNNNRNACTTTTTTEVRKAVTGLPGPSNPPAAATSAAPPLANPIAWPDKSIREQRRRDGLCLLCGSPDHFIPRCPHNQQIARGARSFAELPDPNSVWVESEEGLGYLVDMDEFLEEQEEQESENVDETPETTSET
ncbi:hypothetical protein AAF712_013857 [Marasmius tenuissimus]|uniref:CCHC-type domain-containing protein n=1 Tax=Marasmius tenuissimus TaxID=585030 RepID=A0ABR2ZEP9_9AGAR